MDDIHEVVSIPMYSINTIHVGLNNNETMITLTNNMSIIVEEDCSLLFSNNALSVVYEINK